MGFYDRLLLKIELSEYRGMYHTKETPLYTGIFAHPYQGQNDEIFMLSGSQSSKGQCCHVHKVVKVSTVRSKGW